MSETAGSRERNEEILPRLPDAWFNAVNAGNILFPFSNAGVVTLMLNELLSEGATSGALLRARTNMNWAISEDQVNVFLNSMQHMHTAYATPVAAEGRSQEMLDKTTEKHGPLPEKHFSRMHELGGEEIAKLCFITMEQAVVAYDKMEKGLYSFLGERTTGVIKAYIAEVVRIFSKDEDMRAALTAYKETHRAFSMRTDHAYNRDKDSDIIAARKTITELLFKKMTAYLQNSTILVGFPTLQKERIIERLNDRYLFGVYRDYQAGIL